MARGPAIQVICQVLPGAKHCAKSHRSNQNMTLLRKPHFSNCTMYFLIIKTRRSPPLLQRVLVLTTINKIRILFKNTFFSPRKGSICKRGGSSDRDNSTHGDACLFFLISRIISFLAGGRARRASPTYEDPYFTNGEEQNEHHKKLYYENKYTMPLLVLKVPLFSEYG